MEVGHDSNEAKGDADEFDSESRKQAVTGSRFDFLIFGFRTESNLPFRSREHVGVFEVRALVLVSSFKFLL